MYGNGIQSYRKTDVVTSDPKRLILMCYEGAIDNLKIVRQGIMEKNFEAKGMALSRSHDIISELQCSLDFEKGGEIAASLDSLYNYMTRRLIHAGLKNDVKAVEEVIGMLVELQSAWEEIFSKEYAQVSPEILPIEDEGKRQASNYAAL